MSNRAVGPPAKRRKTDEDSNGQAADPVWDMWDDSLELTQAQLDDIELMASQAYVYDQTADLKPSVSGLERTRGVQFADSFVRPQQPMSRQSSSSTSLTSPETSSTEPGSLTHSSYSSGSASTSIRSSSSDEVILVQRPRLIAHGSSDNGSTPARPRRDQGHDDFASEEINRYRVECAQMRKENENIRKEVYAKEGEIKLLRESLQSRQNDLDQLKQDRAKEISEQTKHSNERENQLQAEINRLQTQLQFKEQEQREFSLRIRDMQIELGKHSSPQKQTSPRKLQMEQQSPCRGQPSLFPTQQTFMAREGSPKRVQAKLSSESAETSKVELKDAGTVTSDIEDSSTKSLLQGRQLGLKLSSKGDYLSGPCLITNLLELSSESPEKIENRGIVGLLQIPSLSAHVQQLRLGRDRSSSVLSPIRNKRLSEMKQALQEKTEVKNTVPIEHFKMAMYALKQLLTGQRDTSFNIEPAVPISAILNIPHTSAMLIIPLLSDYISLYVDLLNCRSGGAFHHSGNMTSKWSSSSSSSSSTCDSSTDSTSVLVRDGSLLFANSMDSLTLVALRVLFKLVSQSKSSRIAIVSPPGGHEESRQLMATENRAESNVSPSVSSVQSTVDKLNLLKMLCQIANPGHRNRTLFNVKVVEASLEVLIMVVRGTAEENSERLLPVLNDELLQNCLECETASSVVVLALRLLANLVCFKKIVSSLCSTEGGCVLLCMYSQFVMPLHSVSDKTILEIYSLILLVMRTISGVHKGGMRLLLDTNCRCSLNVLPMLVHILHNVLKLHVEKKQSSSLSLLRTGLHSLYQLYLHVSNFDMLCLPVEDILVGVMYGLNQLFTDLPNCKEELFYISHLWYFDDEDPTGNTAAGACKQSSSAMERC